MEEIRNDTNEVSTKNSRKKKIVPIVVVVAIIIATVVMFTQFISPSMKYDKAADYINSGDYKSGLEILNEIPDYKGSADLFKSASSVYIDELIQASNYTEAVELISMVDDDDLVIFVVYQLGVAFGNKGVYTSAIDLLELAGDYEDSLELIEEYTEKLG